MPRKMSTDNNPPAAASTATGYSGHRIPATPFGGSESGSSPASRPVQTPAARSSSLEISRARTPRSNDSISRRTERSGKGASKERFMTNPTTTGYPVTQTSGPIHPGEAGGGTSHDAGLTNENLPGSVPAEKPSPPEAPKTQPRGHTGHTSQDIVPKEMDASYDCRVGLTTTNRQLGTHPSSTSPDTLEGAGLPPESNSPPTDDLFETIEKDDQDTADRDPIVKPDSKWPTFSFKKLYKRGLKAAEPQTMQEPSVLKRKWNNLSRREAKDVKTEEIKESDIVIALMGPTGAGKSSFISTAIGFDRGVGHGLESCTSEIGMVRVRVPDEDIDIVLVDTPGFDDTHRSDVEILRLISDWLKKTCENKVLLSGILYLHRISDNRMAGTPLKNLHMFEKLCGPEACNHVIMVTTMWDELSNQEIGDDREYELATTFWKQMIQKGSRTVRYERSPESAWSILGQFLDGSGQQQEMQLQREMVALGKTLPSTYAGQELYKKIDEVVKKQNELVRILRKQMKRSGVEPEIVAALKEQCSRLENERQGTLDELRELKVPIGKRLWNTLNEQTRYLMVFS